MGKYDPIWEYLQKSKKDTVSLSFGQIESILGFAIDHSFLRYKKELEGYGYKTGKISLKEKKIEFTKI